MSERLSCSVAGITELVVGAIAADAKVRSSGDNEEIVVTVAGERQESPELVVEGDKVRLEQGTVVRIELPPRVALSAENALGDLKVSRFEGNLRIQNAYGDLRLDNITGRVDVAHIFADMRADDVAEMHVTECNGDFRFSGGDLDVGSVSGDLRVGHAGNVRGLRVLGDLWAEKLSGSVQVEAAHGDARVSDIGGAVGLGMVAGDFRGSNVRGPLNAGEVHGDATLEGPFPSLEGYSLTTSGDAHIRLTAEDDVRLTVRAAGRIRSNLALIPNADGTPTYTAVLGEGKTRIVVMSSGDLRIESAGGEDVRGPWDRRRGPAMDPFSELSGLGERIRQQVSASLAAAGIDPETGEINLGRPRGGRRTHQGFKPPEPPSPPSAPKSPPAAAPGMSKEQMAVLKMLEEGRISPEEADSLLRALGA